MRQAPFSPLRGCPLLANSHCPAPNQSLRLLITPTFRTSTLHLRQEGGGCEDTHAYLVHPFLRTVRIIAVAWTHHSFPYPSRHSSSRMDACCNLQSRNTRREVRYGAQLPRRVHITYICTPCGTNDTSALGHRRTEKLLLVAFPIAVRLRTAPHSFPPFLLLRRTYGVQSTGRTAVLITEPVLSRKMASPCVGQILARVSYFLLLYTRYDTVSGIYISPRCVFFRAPKNKTHTIVLNQHRREHRSYTTYSTYT